MTHFTLVHGAWHGAWCWDALSKILKARGHTVSCITQTGLGERAGELSLCLLYSTDAADDLLCLDPRARRTTINNNNVSHSLDRFYTLQCYNALCSFSRDLL